MTAHLLHLSNKSFSTLLNSYLYLGFDIMNHTYYVNQKEILVENL
jgi:hypothetical protein